MRLKVDRKLYFKMEYVMMDSNGLTENMATGGVVYLSVLDKFSQQLGGPYGRKTWYPDLSARNK